MDETGEETIEIKTEHDLSGVASLQHDGENREHMNYLKNESESGPGVVDGANVNVDMGGAFNGFQPASQFVRNTLEAAGIPPDAVGRPSEASQPKRRRIHMSASQCQDHVSTQEGALPLTQPAALHTSSKDPHRGLYPRFPAAPKHKTDFVSAKVYHQGPMANFLPASPNTSPTKSNENSSPRKKYPGVGKKKGPASSQSNSMLNYLSQSAKPAAAGSPAQLMNGGNIKQEHGNSTEKPTASHMKSLPRLPSLHDDVVLISSSPERSNSPEAFDDLWQPGAHSKNTKLKKTSKSKPTGNRGVGTKKKTPKFNRDNTFLYSNDPLPAQSTSTCKKESVEGDKYGLLGTGMEPETEEDAVGLSSMPDEVLELILCQLPLMDLMLNVNRVCSYWRNIISHPQFVPWKKRYMAVKLGRAGAQPEVMNMMGQHGMTSKETCLVGLIRYMKTFKKRLPSAIDACLKRHKKYTWALALLKERVADCIEDGVPNPWSMITTLVIISKSVWDIEEVISCLLSRSSQCTALEVVECLYCVATFLLTFHLVYRRDVWHGMHYRLFYALYLYENQSSQMASELNNAFNHAKGGQQSILKYGDGKSSVQLTHEQVRICKRNVEKGDIVKIVAFAGTGKTTTLVRYTQLRPNMKFLLVVFNKSVATHAQKMFPSNVTCKTGHSLAYGHTGRRYAAAKKICLGSMRVMDVLNHFKARKGESLYTQAKMIIETINAYLSSTDLLPTFEHAPSRRIDKDGRTVAIEDHWRQFYAEQACHIWRKMEDINDKSMRITHDGYLKAYQLSQPRIYESQYDILLIDEAQDLTPAIADVLLRQRQAKILVGDPHQQIYAFRGAVNAMQQVEATHTFYLTQSFRFGPEIAYIAASVLEFSKNERKKTLVGNGNPSGVNGQQEGQLAIITRCNFTLFCEAVKKCSFSSEPVKVAFVGGPESFGFDMILDIYALMLPKDQREKEGRYIKHNLVKCFQNLGELEKFANDAMDVELMGKIRIVKTYNTAIPAHIKKIREKCIRDQDMADVVFSTAHKAKGLEFSTVKLTDDFTATGVLNAESAEETNIFYVALTRAKKQLQMPYNLLHLMKTCGENYLFPEPREVKQDESLVCLKTRLPFTPGALTLVRDDFVLSDSKVHKGGVLSPQGVREAFTSLLQLYGSKTDERPELEEDEFMEDFDEFDDFGPDAMEMLLFML